MPYYGVPMTGRTPPRPDPVTSTTPLTGFAFSKSIVTDLLRGKLGFQGYVNSDTGIINSTGRGASSTHGVGARRAAAINGGTDILSGFSDERDDHRPGRRQA